MTEKPALDDRTLRVGRFRIDMTPNKFRPEMNCYLIWYDIITDQERSVSFGECEAADLLVLLEFVQRRGAKYANYSRDELIADWPVYPHFDERYESESRTLGMKRIPSTDRDLPVSVVADEALSGSVLKRAYDAKAEVYFERRAAELAS